jgi:signal transduction histidine kinase
VWLKKLYAEQAEALRKEADNLFQKTMADLQDSLIQNTIEPALPQGKIKFKIDQRFDTIPNTFDTLPLHTQQALRNNHRVIIRPENPQIRLKRATRTDSVPKMRGSMDKNAQIQVYVGASAGNDSLGKLAGNILTKVFEKPTVNDFIIRLENDSLRSKDIAQVFGKSLQKAHLTINFKIIRSTDLAKPISSPGLNTQVFRCFPFLGGQMYYAQLSDYQWFMTKNLIPQFLFSLFLLGITVWAFYWIYRSMRQQQRLAELKNDFISNVTHELKTPVTTVSVAIEALQNFQAIQNPQLTQEYLEISKNELKRLAILIDKILKTAIFDKKGIELKLETLDLSMLVAQVLNSMKLQFEKCQAQVNWHSEGEDFNLTSDTIHLTNVVYNLLDNALKYSPNAPQVTIFLKELPQQLALTIQDQGIGIAPENQKKIFEKFFRVPTGDIHNRKGYGLGLSYVQSVVDKLGGSINLESSLGKGSRFTLYLPKKV